MKKAVVGALLSLGLVGFSSPASARPTTVVELFTAQGCASCAKAGQILEAVDRPHVLTLTFPVDYWDYLGWRDTFAKPEFTARQRAYMRRLALRDVYTPQVVVDGRLEGSAAAINSLLKQADHGIADAPRIVVRHARVSVGEGRAPAGGAEVWLVRYAPQDQTVKVTAGDNRGQSMIEHNVVRDLVRLGAWKGQSTSFRPPPASAGGLKTVVLVQTAHGGRIVAVGAS